MKKWQKKKIIVGNWKMNPVSSKQASKLVKNISSTARSASRVETVVCPPAVYLSELKPLSIGNNLFLGAQDCFYQDQGSYTSQISPKMLSRLGVRYVILGHSEKRAEGEDDLTVALKVKAAVANGLYPIVCIGEQQRDERGDYLNFLKQQLLESLHKVTAKELSKTILAYEPIWAIGQKAKTSATAEDFLEVSIYLRKVLQGQYNRLTSRHTPILYGGSANQDNAQQFLTDGRASGLLLGRASLDAEQFSEIIKIAQNSNNEN